MRAASAERLINSPNPDTATATEVERIERGTSFWLAAGALSNSASFGAPEGVATAWG